jgi:alpha-L-fucosidase
VRWVGNERGIAGDPSWATFDPVAVDGGPASPGDVRDKESPTGHRNGSRWLPAECDVSIRPGWFWHERENARVKTPAQLIDLYYKSVGRGATFLLNVPPNRDGLLNPEDVASLKAFGEYRRKTFGKAVASAKGATIDAKRPVTFNVIRIREDIRQGQRIDSVVVEREDGGSWVEVAKATSVGPRRLIKLDQPVTATKMRARVTEFSAPPVIAEFALFSE